MSFLEDELQKAVDAVFNKYDHDKNGTLETEEVTNLINDALAKMKSKNKVSQQEIDKFIQSVDKNNDRKINK